MDGDGYCVGVEEEAEDTEGIEMGDERWKGERREIPPKLITRGAAVLSVAGPPGGPSSN